MTVNLDDLPAGHWTDAQAAEAMRRVAINAAEGWGGILFLTIEEAFQSGASADLERWAVDVAGATTLNLIRQSEDIAATLALSPEANRQFIADRVGACRRRLEELVDLFDYRASA